MLRRLIVSALIVVSIAIASFAISHAQTFPLRGFFIGISSYDDDPFVADSVVDLMDQSKFSRDDQGRLMLHSDTVTIAEEDWVFRWDSQAEEFKKFAWNPWTEKLKYANPSGDFRFPNEPRFPLHRPERGPDGKVVIKDGLQVWQEQDLHLGNTTAFEAANSVQDAAKFWAQRDLSWGNDGLLTIEPHTFIDFQALYSPSGKMLFFAVLPYRLPGETETRMFEVASDWDLAAHESGHAIHHAIKPNIDQADWGYRLWSESFADQMSMWTSLKDSSRVAKLLETTHGNLNQSNDLSRLGEALGGILGTGIPMRDAFNNNRVSDTDDEPHHRSTVLTGAVYRLFLFAYRELSEKYGAYKGLKDAGDVMGTFLVRAQDYCPENAPLMDDIVRAYLKVDKELFNYKYHAVLVDEFIRRELLDTNSLNKWLAHEASIPAIKLPGHFSDKKFDKFLDDNLDKLGIGPAFGLKLQNVVQETRAKNKNSLAETIVRVQLTQGRGDGATLLNNHGILVFRADGTLADWHSPLPQGNFETPHSDIAVQSQSLAMLNQARVSKLDQHGVPVTLVAKR